MRNSKVPIQLCTDRASVSNSSEALFVEWMRGYISDVVPATEEEVLSSLTGIYGTLPAQDYSTNGAGCSLEETDYECHHFE